MTTNQLIKLFICHKMATIIKLCTKEITSLNNADLVLTDQLFLRALIFYEHVTKYVQNYVYK